MKRGEVWWVDLEPARGGEIKKRRPAVIVSNNSANQYLNRVTVVPCTSAVGKLYISEAIVDLPEKTSKAMANQIRTVSKHRLSERVCELLPKEIQQIDDAMRLHLGL